jgi:hypothetical protein
VGHVPTVDDVFCVKDALSDISFLINIDEILKANQASLYIAICMGVMCGLNTKFNKYTLKYTTSLSQYTVCKLYPHNPI